MSIAVTSTHLSLAEDLVREARLHSGLAPLDLEAFWKAQEIAQADPWGRTNGSQLPLGMQLSHECLFAELNIPEDWYRLSHDPEWLLAASRQYNDKAERIVGRRILAERDPLPADRHWPYVKGLHDIFEGENIWHHESYWLKQAADNEEELTALLDRVEARLENLRDFLLPENWAEEKDRLTALGLETPLYRGQRGPITFATSIYGAENLIYLLNDTPELAARFSRLILRAILGRARVLDEERGWSPEEARHGGWYWADDNCCLLNKELYDFFGRPIMEGVYSTYAPGADDLRGQHSDSDMAQHLPTFAELGMNNVNFGPNLTVRQIRKTLPDALIRGQLAPFTLSRNEEVNLVAECIRDCEMAREGGKGVVFATAGSINNGSRLTGMRLLMATIQRYGQY